MARHPLLKGFYELEKTIGCGGFAKVKLATHVATGEKVAVKIMNKVLLGNDLPRITLELSALKSLSHEHICKLYQVIETESHFYLIMEYCSGGELFDHIVEKNRLSESESRMFFRQIVSAVAYLHSLGYAHRDLKPENVLLDKYQNLKLIDFGLCAKPKGGMESPLFTSCGSPTYAAPELVMGKKYLGPEVDVWAMGVLLYALLTGTLPFDDLNIESLYKKILSGKYHEPSFMSQESLKLIKSMLQVDPKKRITIKELLSHHWLTLDILNPIKVTTEDFKYHDADCIKVLANYYHVEPNMMWKIVQKWNYDYLTSTYFLLLTRKKRNLSLKLSNTASRVDIFDGSYQINTTTIEPDKKENEEELFIKKPEINQTSKNIKNSTESTPQNSRSKRVKPTKDFLEPNRPSSIRKPMKRIRSPGPEDASPVPSKRLNVEYSTPERKPSSDNSDTPGSARRVLGSIERSFHKVVNVLTPRKTEDSSGGKPTILTNKELCNVSTTQCHDPDLVIGELTRALEKKGIQCKRKGYTLRGKFRPNSSQHSSECSFELEICYITSVQLFDKNVQDVETPTKSILKTGAQHIGTPKYYKTSNGNDTVENQFTNPHIVGIRRKRLRGDSWFYKKVCEEVLSITSTCFKGLIESSV